MIVFNRSLLTEQERAIVQIIEDAIWEGAREWDSYAVPPTEKAAARALSRIKEVISCSTDRD